MGLSNHVRILGFQHWGSAVRQNGLLHLEIRNGPARLSEPSQISDSKKQDSIQSGQVGVLMEFIGTQIIDQQKRIV